MPVLMSAQLEVLLALFSCQDIPTGEPGEEESS